MDQFDQFVEELKKLGIEKVNCGEPECFGTVQQ